MGQQVVAILAVAALSLATALADYFIKVASSEAAPIRNRHFLLGTVVYCSTVFGWVFVMRHLKLATIGMLYSLFTTLFLTACGVLLFDERINRYECAGLMLGLVSLALLFRFS